MTLFRHDYHATQINTVSRLNSPSFRLSSDAFMSSPYPTQLQFNLSSLASTSAAAAAAAATATITLSLNGHALTNDTDQFIEDNIWVSQPESSRSDGGGDASTALDTLGSGTICLTWHQCGLFAAFVLLIIVTLIGNTLVILAVLTTRRLRTVTNCFVMSLALADWLVGTFVMPPAVSLFIAGKFLHHEIILSSFVSTRE